MERKIKKPGLAFLFSLGFNLVIMTAFSGQAFQSDDEALLREQLGIPPDANEVIIFAQSSHWDPDWLLTADQYQRLLTDKTLDKALEELDKNPRYIYSVECMFFFKRYWDTHPEKQAVLRDYANQGRIRFTGTGITTPDTLLPEQENLIRDYLAGFEWLKKQGINADPKLAYLPDCFGHSPTLPSILRELGYKYTAFARIDGMYFIATDYRPRSAYPTPGSSAELLGKKHRTLDFVWQAPDGSEVLAHWNAYTYMQGDMIDHSGVVHVFSIHLGIPARSTKKTNAKIDSYIRQLRHLSRTGYMFCPIGGDFNPPVPDLVSILDTYNRDRYPETGVFALLAGLEDYMRLVEFHKDELPVLALDINPLWMGFYSSRPELKQRCRNLSRDLILAESLGILAQDQGHTGAYPDLAWPWEVSLFSNHHDFITGTSPDRVYVKEQIPVLKDAQARVDDALESLTEKLNLPAGACPPAIRWNMAGSTLKVENEFYIVEIDAKKGGCISRWYDRAEDRDMLSGPSNDVVLYQDTGGLWRMGHELITGKFRELARASEVPAEINAREKNGILVVTVASELEGRRFLRYVYFRSDEPLVRMKLRGSLNRGRTATVCFRTAVSPGRFIQEVPFGVLERPLKKNFDPTFWAVKNWIDLVDYSEEFGVNLAIAAPAAVHASESGSLEMIALRYTPQERVLGMPVLSFPAIGSDPYEHEFEYGFFSHGHKDWLERSVFSQAQTVLNDSWIAPEKPDIQGLALSLVQTDRKDVVVTSLKKAESGNGVIVRLLRYAPEPVTVRLTYSGHEGSGGRDVKEAFRTDALERVQKPLEVRDGNVELEMPYSLATVLLLF